LPSSVPVSEGFVSFGGFRSWYRVVGDLAQPAPAKFPLLVLHGGPGGPSDYLVPLEELADTGRPIVFYDQLGGGNSDQPHDPSLWSVRNLRTSWTSSSDRLPEKAVSQARARVHTYAAAHTLAYSALTTGGWLEAA
jgi:pimeloyl-ACP methyl ester carboxylesterase